VNLNRWKCNFVRPGDEIMSSGRARLKWHLSLGLGEENYRFHDHEKLAHYANAAQSLIFLLDSKN
jgi:glycyl-tRNA synthetase